MLKCIVPIIGLVLSYIFAHLSIFTIFAGVLPGATNDTIQNAYIYATLSIILNIISSIYIYIKALTYTFSYYISYDNPGLSSKEAFKQSKKLMYGNKGTYFVLHLSFAVIFAIIVMLLNFLIEHMAIDFFAKIILKLLVEGCMILWLFPYMNVASVCLYDDLVKKIDTNDIINNNKSSINENNGFHHEIDN